MLRTQNRLIERLPRPERARLLASCENVPLVASEVLCVAGSRARHAYFPVTGFIALVTQLDGQPGPEVGMIGNEGLLGTQIALGVSVAPLHAMVLGAGSALRIRTSSFRREIAASGPLHAHLQRYVHVLMCQLAVSAACLRFHLIGPRLARWLLMSQDRAEADHFLVTHEVLAIMLGVRREGITQAAGALQAAGLIRYHRGAVEVLDRGGLEAAACSCYANDNAARVHLL